MPDDLHEGDTRALIQCLQRGYLAATAAVKDLTVRAETAEARVADYENGISWNVTCTGCAKLLDRCYDETVRAEKAESALRQALGWVDSGQYWKAREIIKAALGDTEEGGRG